MVTDSISMTRLMKSYMRFVLAGVVFVLLGVILVSYLSVRQHVPHQLAERHIDLRHNEGRHVTKTKKNARGYRFRLPISGKSGEIKRQNKHHGKKHSKNQGPDIDENESLSHKGGQLARQIGDRAGVNGHRGKDSHAPLGEIHKTKASLEHNFGVRGRRGQVGLDDGRDDEHTEARRKGTKLANGVTSRLRSSNKHKMLSDGFVQMAHTLKTRALKKSNHSKSISGLPRKAVHGSVKSLLHKADHDKFGVLHKTDHDKLGVLHKADHDRFGVLHKTNHDKLGVLHKADHDRLGTPHKADHDRLGVLHKADHDKTKLGILHKGDHDRVNLHMPHKADHDKANPVLLHKVNHDNAKLDVPRNADRNKAMPGVQPKVGNGKAKLGEFHRAHHDQVGLTLGELHTADHDQAKLGALHRANQQVLQKSAFDKFRNGVRHETDHDKSKADMLRGSRHIKT